MSNYAYFCGIELAKNHFSLHAVDQNGKVILHKSVTRTKLLTTIANMPLMRIGVEACDGAQYWQEHSIDWDTMFVLWLLNMCSHQTRRKNDAVAICEAVQRPQLISYLLNLGILSMYRMKALGS
ncbi:hypothetical protein VHA01S_029_00360 [Vibrio halioticoli NBRC 102217]|uniref:Uncharacterized protein n=1 Tax=Vibrio halioticoli NBRC 102217 TaxID=1219072 RepID=V5FE31_9VIBR|nr:hypothetical protein VHA01S_029_00360 [Vibrio halioticoli NBRC 102217]